MVPPPRSAIPAASGVPDNGGPGVFGEDVQTQNLAAVTPDSIGLLDAQHGGFPPDLWSGTPISLVDKILPDLPFATPSRVLRQTLRRLLLSAAIVPEGKPGAVSLLMLRAHGLWAMGETDSLADFLKLVPANAIIPELRRLAIDVALLRGDDAGACAAADALAKQSSDLAVSGETNVFCRFAAGNAGEAGLALDLLREQKIDDAPFFALAEALSGLPPANIEQLLTNPTPLTLAMSRLAKVALPVPAATVTQPALLRAIALAPNATPEARLAAGTRAAAIGALDTRSLAQIYKSVVFSPQEMANPPRDAASAGTPRGQAFLYQAAMQPIQPLAKADLIGRALASASSAEGFMAASELYASEIAALAPAPELTNFSPLAVRALIVSQHPDQAANWVAFIHDQAGSASDALKVAENLAVLQRLHGDEGPHLSSAALAAWRQATGELPRDSEARRTALGFSLLAAIGEKPAAEDWLPLYEEPFVSQFQEPRPALWQGLNLATENARLGETMLLSLATLGDGDLSHAGVNSLYRVVVALRGVGQEDLARSLALEAALVNGI